MIRWVINPVVTEIGEDGRTYVRPLVSALGFAHSSVIRPDFSWCLSFVRGDDLSMLDADVRCIDLLEQDYEDENNVLYLRFNNLSTVRRNRILRRLQDRDVDTSKYLSTVSLAELVRDVGKKVDPTFSDPLALYTRTENTAARLRMLPTNLAEDPGDTFVEGSTVALTAHTPTGTDPGSGWTEEEKTGTVSARVNATVDRCEPTGAEASDRILYTLQPNPSSAEYDISATLQVSTITTSPIYLVGRFTDTSNYYSAGTYRSSDANDKRIFKTVSGTPTELASADSGIANGDVLLFEVRNATKKLYKNGVEQISTADNALTSSGRIGFGLGNAWAAGDDIGAAWQIKPFSYTQVSGVVERTVSITSGATVTLVSGFATVVGETVAPHAVAEVDAITGVIQGRTVNLTGVSVVTVLGDNAAGGVIEERTVTIMASSSVAPLSASIAGRTVMIDTTSVVTFLDAKIVAQLLMISSTSIFSPVSGAIQGRTLAIVCTSAFNVIGDDASAPTPEAVTYYPTWRPRRKR